MAQNLTEDGKVTKRIIKAGEGLQPKKKSEVSVHYEAFLVKQDSKFDSSRDRNAPFAFTLNGGQVIEAWEIAVPTMKVGEVAEITCSYEYGYGEKGRAPIVPKKASLRFVVELLGAWEPAGSARQRLEAAASKKEEGNELFKKGAVDKALFAYRRARDYIIDLWDCEPEEQVECRELVIAIQSNIAICYIKLREWDNALEVCKKVLDRDPCNVKACYRIGQISTETLDFEEGIQYVKLGLQVIIN
ncbi:hypothetical protein BDB00DRAFT_773798 [Zychaea mexicana]|uniref:uncharacterized protein n=1 Tax=Zychaea mexicana TaxID=64656 RepID=UPI0022FE0FFB|nr:uncharacterized protein BDB00DRAFT_773798 [Zychaea mexicana]KAI9485024.1 hypothetical protein BDB00DRAFT_773798 [Zychaea mexicana]